MRIAVVSPYDPYPAVDLPGAHVGGVERMLAEVSERLADRGHEVIIVCSAVDLRPGREPPHVKVVRMPRHGTLLRAPIARLVRGIPQDVDIIHVPATYPFTTPSVLRFARRFHIPCVLDFHFEPQPGTFIGRLAAAAYRQIGPRSYRHADAVLVRSKEYAAGCPSLAATPAGKLHALPNGIDPRRFQPGRQPPDNAPILFVGRLVPYKGLSVLLQALGRIDNAPPLWVVGDGPLRRGLEAEADRLGIDVTFHGHVPDAALPEYYRRARLTVLPSVTGQECFGITLIESMACGTPVVASSLPGVRAIGQISGPTARPGDVEDLASVLQQALQNQGLRGPNLAGVVYDRFSWHAVTQRLESIYEGIQPDRPPLVTYAHPRRDAVL